MLIGRVQRCVQSKIYSNTATHESFAIEVLADLNGGVNIEERGYDAAEGFQWCPGMNRRILIYGFADLDKV